MDGVISAPAGSLSPMSVRLLVTGRDGRAPVTSWLPVDLGPVLDGTPKRIIPEIGRRDDVVCMFCPGRSHSIVSESGGGKPWLALTVTCLQMSLGHDVVYLDIEDDEHGITERLQNASRSSAPALKRSAATFATSGRTPPSPPPRA